MTRCFRLTTRAVFVPRLMISLLGVVAVAACSPDASSLVGRAGEDRIDAAEVKRIVDALPETTRAAVYADKQVLERVVRAELVRRALLAEARAAKIESDPKVAAELERAREDALARLWVARQGATSSDYPGEDDVKLAYQSSAAALGAPTQYRIAQIFVAAPNGVEPGRLADAMRKAAEVGRQIDGGDFAALARQYSEHAESAQRGGDVGLLDANQILPEIVAAVRELEPGQTAGPIKTSQGLHYVKLLEKKASAVPTLDQVREQLQAALRARRAQELEQAYLAALDARLDVSIDQIALSELVAGNATAAATSPKP